MKNKQLFSNEASLKKYHTYGIDAKCSYLTVISSEEELKEVFLFINEKNLPYVFLGKGSNVLFKDDYYHGVVIINKMNHFLINEEIVEAEGGVNLALLARKTSKMGLSGFEHLVGIPGTIGGSICMNAGVSDIQISTLLTKVEVMLSSGEKKTFLKDECGFSYRHSSFIDSKAFVLRAFFSLNKKEDALKDLHEHLLKRLKTQPISKKNSGCVFKNPSKELSAGALIDACGLKGKISGGAIVSIKHANFINNSNLATYSDVAALIEEVQKIVKEKMGVNLECEVRII